MLTQHNKRYLRGTDAIKLAKKFVRTVFPSQVCKRSTVDEKT